MTLQTSEDVNPITPNISASMPGRLFVLFEIFHDVQYLAIVWLFNRKRVDTDPQVGGFTRFVFRHFLVGSFDVF